VAVYIIGRNECKEKSEAKRYRSSNRLKSNRLKEAANIEHTYLDRLIGPGEVFDRKEGFEDANNSNSEAKISEELKTKYTLSQSDI